MIGLKIASYDKSGAAHLCNDSYLPEQSSSAAMTDGKYEP